MCFVASAAPSRILYLTVYTREVPSYLQLIQQLQHEGVDIDLLAVDGFGALHPRGAGAATQLGVQARLACIGVGKSLSGICSLREREVVAFMDKSACLQLDISSFCSMDASSDSDNFNIRCVAVRKDATSRRPVYVSVKPKAPNSKPYHPRDLTCTSQVGHMCCIDTAASVISSCLIFSQPEPIRLADIASRAALRVNAHQVEECATAAVRSAIAPYNKK